MTRAHGKPFPYRPIKRRFTDRITFWLEVDPRPAIKGFNTINKEQP